MTEPTFQIKAEVEQQGFGKFMLEPLEQGYGQTLGNSLRRVLLTSLPGAAITSVKVEGVRHQYSTLPGMKEDVVEFLLNLKKVRLTLEGAETATMTLKKSGPGVVTAADIDVSAGVTIVNPDLVLANLADKKVTLDAQMTVTKGFGYVPVEERQNEEVGMLLIDALYTPIVRVNYRVEATRVGRMTNLDRLVMEIWTDGTISPRAALTQSAKQLVSYFSQVYDPQVAGAVEAPVATQTVSDEVMKMRIEELDIPTRIVNALSNGGIDTIGQMVATPRSELMKIKNLGGKSLSIVEDKLKEKGVTIPA
jgi:DNA-directed RNA polymerase subunit alpha